MQHSHFESQQWVGATIAVFLMFSIVGCRGDHPPQAKISQGFDDIKMDEAKIIPALKHAPDWVNKGSDFLASGDKRYFIGVGYSAPMGDMAFQKSVADDMARAEVERVLAFFQNALAKDYLLADRVGRLDAKDRDMKAEAISRLLVITSKASMANTRISGSWRDLKSSNIWSSAELDMQYLKRAIAGASDIDSELKIYMASATDEVFNRMVREKISVNSAPVRSRYE